VQKEDWWKWMVSVLVCSFGIGSGERISAELFQEVNLCVEDKKWLVSQPKE